MKKRPTWRLAIAAATVAGAAAALAVPWSASFVERTFSRNVYVSLQSVLTRLSSSTPFSWLDVLVAGAIAWVSWGAWRVVRGPRGTRGWTLLANLRTLVLVAAVAYLVFVAVWGLNYQREPLRSQLGFDPTRVTDVAALAFAERAVGEANAARERVVEAGDESTDVATVVAGLRDPFARTLRDLGLPVVRPAQPKVPVIAWYFDAAGVSGMTNPFGLETLMAGNLLPFERPLVIAHEWGHLAGLGPESEAGFVGFLTCVRGDSLARYSAWLDISLRALRGVAVADRRALAARLSPGVRADIGAMAERSRRDEWPSVSQAAWNLYDRYLRAHRVGSGLRSYDEVVTLLIGTRRGLPE